jgi:CheY-like chemotaxis protein/HPt (histidine-containing phosphotransfer) domain-containing protein
MSEGDGRIGALEARLAALAAGVRAELPARAKALRTAIEALEGGDEEARTTVGRLAHMIRGTAGSHGMHALTEPAARVESASRAAPVPELAHLTRALADAIETTAAATVPAPVEARPVAPPSAGLVKPLAGRAVLAIDDDPATRRLLGMTLSNLGGASTSIEESPTAFFAALEARTFDVIVVDAMMPEMNGRAILERIAGSPLARPSARYFVLSAAEQSELRWELPKTLAVTWLRKPFRPRDLLDAIQSALAG